MLKHHKFHIYILNILVLISLIFNITSCSKKIKYELFAHAGGALWSYEKEIYPSELKNNYTNCLEGIKENYVKGHRIFEIDFQLTSDDELVLVHDWNIGRQITNSSWTSAPTLAEWKVAKIYDKYTTMSFDDLIVLMKKYKGIKIITDTKYIDNESNNKVFSKISSIAKNLIERFFIQIYNPQMFEYLNTIYPFKKIIYTLYNTNQTLEEVYEYVKDNSQIYAITMYHQLYEQHQDYVLKFKELGKKIYAHTINDPTWIKTQFANGTLDGVYTDTVTYQDIK